MTPVLIKKLRMDTPGQGRQLAIDPIDEPFLGAEGPDDWDDEQQQSYQELVRTNRWNPEFGDRRSEIVFIGVHLNKELIAERLRAALLTAEESQALGGVEGWRQLDDAFFGSKCAEMYFEVQYESVEAEGGEGEETDDSDDDDAGVVAPKRKSSTKDSRPSHGKKQKKAPV
eukprot:COSAG01_NODE_10860_length_2066_cov_3.117438_1_plen_171_part_00